MRNKAYIEDVCKEARLHWITRGSIALSLAVFINSIAWAAGQAGGQFIANNTPSFVKTSKDLGPESPSKVIDVTVWLNLHNRGELDSLAEELYDPNSTSYHRWLKRADFAARFAPMGGEAQVVEKFLSAHNLPVVMIGAENFFVQARGTIAEVEKAFQVRINRFDVNGKIQRANTSNPYIEGAAAALVRSVSGLDDLKFEHPLKMRPSHLSNQPSTLESKAAIAANDAAFFSSNCFPGVKTEKYTTDGTFPIAVYRGNSYFSPLAQPGCGYTPPEMHTAYNLNGLYKAGFDGSGQTIVIIDFCGSPTILQDANAFSSRFGLPHLNSSNFQTITLFGPTECEGIGDTPDVEIHLDVEWAHAIAPGANIDLLIAGQGDISQTDEAEYFAIINNLGSVISGSYGIPELLFLPGDLAELENENLLNEIAAVFGVAANFSSGDDGDFTDQQIPCDNFAVCPTVSAPADSQYATAVGGVSLALNSNDTIKFQTGWGNNETELAVQGLIDYPPSQFGFIGGSGGGPSSVFSKPSFQRRLPGRFRQLPDISWLADPFTPGVILITESAISPPQIWEVVGGTSLSCPMFSALWAIANQEAGTLLGQAAPYLYRMPKGTITDVVPVSSPTNVTGTIYLSSTLSTHFTAADLAQPLENTTKFYSFLWDYPYFEDTTLVITLGTDTSLTVAPGWDNVTGLGTPNGKAFADFFNPAH